MKNRIMLLLALALTLAVPHVASAQSQILTLDRLKWARGVSSYGLGVTDSTRISILPATTTNDFADTTAWFDVGQFKFNQDYAKQPLVMFQINKQLTTTTDSIGYALQYTNDIGAGSNAVLPASVAVAYLTTVAASTYGGSAGNDGIVGTVPAVTSDAVTVATGQASGTTAGNAIMPFRFVRLIVLNADTSGATGRSYFSVRPVVYGSR